MIQKNITTLTHIDIVLSVFNQENLIERVLYGIFKNTSTPFILIIVFDGCKDKTEERARKYIRHYSPSVMKKFIATHAPNVFETRANNIGFKIATSDFMITLQDDMVINEFGWERRLTYPLRKFNDVFAVTSRSAHDIDKIDENYQYYINKAARECDSLSRNIFAVRDIINRGPIAFNMKYLRTLNFLNEAYAPSDLDDADISLRAWRQHKLRVGAYWINYISPAHWGKARSNDSTMLLGNHISRNGIRLFNDHRDYIISGVKHSENILIPEDEVDYANKKIYHILYLLFKPIRIHKKGIERTWMNTRIRLREITLKALSILGVKNAHERGLKKILIFKR